MSKKYRLEFKFVDTEEEAKDFCDKHQAQQNAYGKRKHKPHYTPWASTDNKEHKFVVWYYI